jgi:hypothetical protein
MCREESISDAVREDRFFCQRRPLLLIPYSCEKHLGDLLIITKPKAAPLIKRPFLTDCRPLPHGVIQASARSQMFGYTNREHYYFPWELENAIAEWVQHYNHDRYHESLDNMTPADVYDGRMNGIQDQHAIIKSHTLMQR